MTGLKITCASFEEALELNDAVAEAIAEKDIDLNPEVFSGEIDGRSFGSVLKAVLELAKSKRVREALFVCAKRALYKGAPVDVDFFEKVENRKLYYLIMIEVMKENLGPFFEDLFGSLKNLDLGGIMKNGPQE